MLYHEVSNRSRYYMNNMYITIYILLFFYSILNSLMEFHGINITVPITYKTSYNTDVKSIIHISI